MPQSATPSQQHNRGAVQGELHSSISCRIPSTISKNLRRLDRYVQLKRTVIEITKVNCSRSVWTIKIKFLIYFKRLFFLTFIYIDISIAQYIFIYIYITQITALMWYSWLLYKLTTVLKDMFSTQPNLTTVLKDIYPT